MGRIFEPKDQKVLKCSSDLLNNVKIVQGQRQHILKHILLYQILGWWPFCSSDLKQTSEYFIKSPLISEKKMSRLVCGSRNKWPWRKGYRSA